MIIDGAMKTLPIERFFVFLIVAYHVMLSELNDAFVSGQKILRQPDMQIENGLGYVQTGE
jgi:hypothetical protein